jgi:hypothetical protein
MKRYIFIIRIVKDDDGGLRGQLTEPVSGQRMLFSTPAELWAALIRQFPASPAPPDRSSYLSPDKPLSR